MHKVMPQQKAGLEIKEIGGETLLIDGEDIHVLNPTAALIWKLCDGAHTLDDMAAALGAEYEIPADHDVMVDIERTLGDLRTKGLLHDA